MADPAQLSEAVLVRMRKVTAGTLAANAPMLAVMRAAGTVQDGRRARHVLLDGAEVDVVYGALFRADFVGETR